jgi:glutamyl-tRNA reductase
MIDLAVPRDVEPEVRSIERVRFYDLDDLRSQAGAVAEERSGAIPLVEQIIREEVEGFQQWLCGLSVAPLITDLRRKAEAIRERELGRALSRLPNIDAETMRQFEHLSRTLVNGILHDPTTRLRDAAGQGVGREKAEAVRHLFDLPSDQKPHVEKLS